MNKRGSHVGIILSFVIFATFLIFIYTTLQPTLKTGREKQVILDHIKQVTMDEITGNLTIVSVRLNQADPTVPPNSCFSLADIQEVSRQEGSIVKDVNGNIISSKRNAGVISAAWNGQAGEFFRIIYSEQNFTEKKLTTPTCYNLNSAPSGFYTLNVNRDEQILATKINMMLVDYGGKHELLREKFSVPADSDFAISTTMGGVFLGGEPPASSVNVFSEDIVFQYVNNTADVTTGKIRVSVW
ncbi:Uncharacterised protein [uncultured archaeon]|nr:Uncharacterised protein [uncultured archaeon]